MRRLALPRRQAIPRPIRLQIDYTLGETCQTASHRAYTLYTRLWSHRTVAGTPTLDVHDQSIGLSLHHQNRVRSRAAHLQRPTERAAAPRWPTRLILCTDDEGSQEDVKPGRWSRVGALTQGGVTEVAGRDRRERASVRRGGSGSRHATHLDSGNSHRGHVEQPSCGCQANERSAMHAGMHVNDACRRRCD